MNTPIQNKAEEDGFRQDVGKRDKLWTVWRKADAQAVLERWKRSGLSIRQFTEQEGFSQNRLYNWRKKLFPQDAINSSSLKMLPVKIVGSMGPGSNKQITEVRSSMLSQDDIMEVVCHNGWIVRVRPGFDIAALNRLVGLLSNNQPC
jgi:hypothetical protein